MKRRGFTLIELLVVIAIIAIIAAILFPVFIQAKDASKIAQCSNNLKQLSSAVMLYRDAWDDCLPIHQSQLGDQYPEHNYTVYMIGLYPYLKVSTASFTCPNQYYPEVKVVNGQIQATDRKGHYQCWSQGVYKILEHNKNNPNDQWYYPLQVTDPKRVTAYAALEYPGQTRDGRRYFKVSSHQRYRKQTRTVYLFEATLDLINWNNGLKYDYWEEIPPADKDYGRGMRAGRHNGRSCILYYDGHVACPTNAYITSHAGELFGYDSGEF